MPLKAITDPKVIAQTSGPRYLPPPQEGPLRFSDVPKHCVRRGCRTKTLIRINGAVLCGVCALHELNRLFIVLESSLSPDRKQRLEDYIKEMTECNYYKSDSAWDALYVLYFSIANDGRDSND